MSYVQKVLTPNEKLLFVTRPHWIYLWEGLLFLALMLVMGYVSDLFFYKLVAEYGIDYVFDFGIIHFDKYSTPIPWFFALIGLAVFWPLFLGYITTEVGLTDTRIIHKKGLFSIEIEQVDLEDIRAEHVLHGWLGWLLGYGKINLDCRFVGDMSLPAMKKPYRLIKAAHIARLKHPKIDFDEEDLQVSFKEISQAMAHKHPKAIQQQKAKKLIDKTL